MNIALTILRLRFLQLIRIMLDIGWLYLLLIAPIAFIGLLLLLQIARDHPGWLGIGVCLLILSLHLQRKDKAFLNFLNTSTFVFCACEYSVAVLPVSLILLVVLNDWQDAMFLQSGAIAIAMIPLRIRQKQWQGRLYKMNWLPTKAIEWKSGFRRYIWFFLVVYIAALPLTIYTATVPVVILLFAIIATVFYDDIEGKELLEAVEKPEYLLSHKIKMQLAVFHLLLAPYYLLFLFFHYKYWYVLPAVLILAQSLLCFALFFKYANYAPFRQKLHNQTPVGIAFICLLLPVFLPGVIIYCIYYYRKALNNLKFFYAEHQ